MSQNDIPQNNVPASTTPQEQSASTEPARENLDTGSQGSPGAKPSNSRAKLVFLLVVLGAAGAIWWFQREKDPVLDGWATDYNQACKQAQDERKNLLIFFTSDPMTSDDKNQIRNAVAHDRTRRALAKSAIVKVHLNTRNDAETAKLFKVGKTPVAILLDSSRKELNRLGGTTNDVDFYNKFLGLSLQE